MRVDTHVHFWHYDPVEFDWINDGMADLKRHYLPTELFSTLKRNGIDACIAVQARQSELETHFLVELARKYDTIRGVVGWVDLQNHDLAERLAYFSQYPEIKGWRHVVQGEAPGFLLQKKFQDGIAQLQLYGYTYDLLIYHYQLKESVAFVRNFPELKIVIDHCAKPDIASQNLDEWKGHMKEMAAFPNVSCKLSGLFTEAKWKQWKPGEFYPYLDVLFEAFGIDRLLFGSDWPVMLLSGMYVQWVSLLNKYMEQFSDDDKEKLFGGNAISFYNLSV